MIHCRTDQAGSIAAGSEAAKVLSVSVCRGLRHYGVYECAALHR